MLKKIAIIALASVVFSFGLTACNATTDNSAATTAQTSDEGAAANTNTNASTDQTTTQENTNK